MLFHAGHWAVRAHNSCFVITLANPKVEMLLICAWAWFPSAALHYKHVQLFKKDKQLLSERNPHRNTGPIHTALHRAMPNIGDRKTLSLKDTRQPQYKQSRARRQDDSLQTHQHFGSHLNPALDMTIDHSAPANMGTSLQWHTVTQQLMTGRARYLSKYRLVHSSELDFPSLATRKEQVHDLTGLNRLWWWWWWGVGGGKMMKRLQWAVQLWKAVGSFHSVRLLRALDPSVGGRCVEWSAQVQCEDPGMCATECECVCVFQRQGGWEDKRGWGFGGGVSPSVVSGKQFWNMYLFIKRKCFCRHSSLNLCHVIMSNLCFSLIRTLKLIKQTVGH